ncbi:MAG: hypothetical protein B6I18_07925 [Bacteroidetes bacterium 4572_112]|nr:MAG: hypothetical protein B6I18_07925 [Bacteroidetes bacterium 4572_112]
MNKLYLIIAFVIAATGIIAQPSDAKIKGLINDIYGNNINSVKLRKGYTKELLENGRRIIVYRRGYDYIAKTKFSGVTYEGSGSFEYLKSGGSYSYRKHFTSAGVYKGIPDPKTETVQNYLNSNLKDFIKYDYDYIVGNISEITLTPNTKYKWIAPNVVEFYADVEYSKKSSNTELTKTRHTYEVYLYSEKYQSPFNNDKITDNATIYQKTHCQYPKVKEEQYGMIAFYDKERGRGVGFVGVEEDNTWKLRTIRYYPAKEDDVKRMENSAGSCGDKPALAVEKVIKYEIGDIVDIKFSNGMFAAKVEKKDNNFDNRYYVKLIDGGRGYWKTSDEMSPSTAKEKSTVSKMGTVSSTVKSEKVSFIVGDKVSVKTRSGNMNGKIVKSSGSKFLIKLNDFRYKDMWVAPANLIKR